MTPEQVEELDRILPIAQAMLRDAKPRKPEGQGWIFRSSVRDCDWPMGEAPYGLEFGDYTAAMLHGGTTVVGNLLGAISWHLVTAIKYLPKSDAPWRQTQYSKHKEP